MNNKSKFTYEYCKSETSKMIFYNELTGTSLYNFLLYKGKKWHHELTQHLIRTEKPKGTYTYEYCKVETQKLTYYSELQGTTLYGVLKKHPTWLKELTQHLIRKQKPSGYWLHNKERCQNEALKYQTRTDFQKGSKSAYGAAHKNGWLDEICSHMNYVQLPNNYWKPEMIIECAKKYDNPKEWVANDYKSYSAAIKLNMMDECMKYMEYIFKPNGWWTYERCEDAVTKCDTLKEFRDNYDGAYKAILRENWGNLLINLKRGNHKQYTLNECKKEALKYNSRTELINGNPSVYNKIKKMKWNDKCYKHMKRKMTLKERHIYAFEFSDNYVYVGLTCQIERRKRAHLGLEDKNNKKRREKSPVYVHMTKTNLKPIFKQLTLKPIKEEHAPLKEKYYINQYKKNGWILLNKATAGSLGSMKLKWTDKYVQEIANKHTIFEIFNKKIPTNIRKDLKKRGLWENIISHMTKTRKENGEWNHEDCIKAMKSCESISEFQKKYSGALKYAKRHNLLKGNLPTREERIRNKQKIFEDFEKCKKEALKYNMRNDFYKNSREYYRAAKRMGWLDKICEHMKIKPTPNIKPEILLENIRKTALPYKNRWEWGKNNPREYRIAMKNKWLDNVCAHMKPTMNQLLNPNIYTFEICLQEAKKYEYKYQFRLNSKYHYLTAKKMGWLDKICSHMIKRDTVPIGYWNNKENVQKVALTCKHRSEFQKKYSGAFKSAKKNNWLNEFFPKNI